MPGCAPCRRLPTRQVVTEDESHLAAPLAVSPLVVGDGGPRWGLDTGEGAGADAREEGLARRASTVDLQPSRPRRLLVGDVPQVPVGQGLAVGPNDQVLSATRIGRADLGVGLAQQ